MYSTYRNIRIVGVIIVLIIVLRVKKDDMVLASYGNVWINRIVLA
uniref:Uncharacterized protein n=1 Tax=Anguilla anguilla TaxID=7936 RepID=A0A0E9V1U6_ANGAN